MAAILLHNQGGESENEQESDDMAAHHDYEKVLPMISILIKGGIYSIKYDDTAENIFHTETSESSVQ